MHACTDPHCLKHQQRPGLGKVHGYLLRNKIYHHWHHQPHHRAVHIATASVHSVLAIALIIASTFVPTDGPVRASGSWAQTDWSSGSGSSTTNQYASATNIDATTTSGTIALSRSEQFTNTGVNTTNQIDAWLGVTPTSVSGLTMWVTADAGAYTDAGSTLATNGQTVRQWNDQSGSSNHIGQSTSTNRPTYTTNVLNGRGVLRFDGTNDYLDLASPATQLLGTNEMSAFLVAKSDYTASSQTLFGFYTGGSNIGIMSGVNPTHTGWNENFGVDVAVEGRTGSAGWQYGTIQLGSTFSVGSYLVGTTSFAHYLNGAANVTPKTQSGEFSTNNQSLLLGARRDCLTGCNIFDGDIAEFMTYSSSLSSGNREAVENYLGNKYALGGRTFTLETSTKRSGDGALKAIAPSGDAVEALQMVNVGDTNTYNLVAYAYTDGGAVSSSDVELYSNGATVTTAFTSVGSGWYRLTGTVTGANANRSYGVQVKATKTVYLDDFSLYKFASSGSLTSNIFDTGSASNWGTASFTTGGTGTTTVKVRTSTSATMVGATAFASCSAISSDADISSNGCVTDTHRYIQYEISVSTADVSVSPTVTDITFNYSPADTQAPNNPSSVTAKNTNGGDVTLTSGNWYNYTTPHFSWSEPTDNADTEAGEAASGIADYYVYFGTDNSADPATAGSVQSGRTYSASGLSSGATYYLRIKTRDVVGNVASAATLFSYKFDSTTPSNPAFVSVSPSGYTSTNSFTFLWPGSGGNAASDAHSGIAGYQYKTGASSGGYSSYSSTTTATEVTLATAAYTEGANIFYLRTVDTAGNTSSPIQVTFYYAGSAPSAPQSLSVSPTTSSGSPASTNSFSFSWGAPASYNGSIKQYRYAINALPTSTNTTITTGTSLSSGAYATQQGQNTLYVVAEDEAGNINYSVYASVDFYAQTAAPGIPTSLQVYDISDRAAQEYATSLKWIAPTNQGTGFAGYTIYRSTDNSSFAAVGTTTGTTYSDTSLSSTKYYYQVKARDNAGQFSTASSTVSVTPTGRYTTAPALSESPKVSSKAFSATISWETDREGSSFIEYGTDANKLGEERGGKTQGKLEQTKKHSIILNGLDPETVYTYQAVWVDSDGNTGRSDTLSFKTGDRPKISEVKVSNITLSSATVAWKSTTISTTAVNYGKTTSYGGSVTDKSGSQTTTHTINLTELDHSSTYNFQITGTDTDGNTLASDNYTFATLTKPAISDLRFESVKEAATSSLRFTWTTNVPTTSIVSYQSGGGTTLSQSQADYKTDHDLTVTGLADQTTYTLFARGVDQYGNTTVSDANTFTTPDDTRAPKISNLTVEIRSTGVGTGQKAQIVASWETDEPATSQIEYGPGISADSYTAKSQEDGVYTTNHVVIVSELEPSKLYHLRAVSRDKAGNAGYSTDTTAITGKIQRSVIDVIVNSLERSLGFLGRLPFLSTR